MPYILNTAKDIRAMLKSIGVESVDDLYASLPQSIKLKDPLDIDSGLSEFDASRKVTALSNKNITLDKFNSFLGAGSYDHYVPLALKSILSSSQFLTAYTPYQAECSQGILQAIYEYQSYICFLTGLDISNASLFDGASALAESVLMSLRITKRKKVIVAGMHHPEYLETLKTYLSGFDFIIEYVDAGEDGCVDLETLKSKIDTQTGCCAIQSPNFFGLIEDAEQIAAIAKENGALTVMVTNPLSLVLFKEPGIFGVDIVCGDGQPFGSGLCFGGPSFGFMAAKKDYLRQMPGRIVGKTTDREDNPAYCLTLQTREQHIRRQNATSNICSNQSLNAIGAAVYLSLMGASGMNNIASYSFKNTQYLYNRLSQIRGVTVPFSNRVFNEFIWQVDNAQALMQELYKRNIIAGFYLGGVSDKYSNSILSCCTEKKTKEDIDNLVNIVAEVLHGK